MTDSISFTRWSSDAAHGPALMSLCRGVWRLGVQRDCKVRRARVLGAVFEAMTKATRLMLCAFRLAADQELKYRLQHILYMYCCLSITCDETVLLSLQELDNVRCVC